MQEKRMKVWKRATALVMSAILVAVSLPLALAADPLAAGTYDPVPTFSEDAALLAWAEDTGDVVVSVPRAVPNTQYLADKYIETYYITLYNLGPYTELHNDPATESVPSMTVTLDATAMTFASDATVEVTLSAADLAAAGVTLNSTDRFCVAVLAQDNRGWVSEQISTIVSDVPRFEYDAEAYEPLTENATGMREMLMFEQSKPSSSAYSDSTLSTDGAGSGSLDYVASSSTGANQLDFRGSATWAGDGGTGAYHFYVTGTNDQTFNTTWSREHWIASGAEEIWFWFDFSQVSVEGLALELKTQQKRYGEFYWNNNFINTNPTDANRGDIIYDANSDDSYSTVTYSTAGTTAAGYTGEAPYVFVQADNGAWEKVMLTDGRLDIADYKGYIRVPIDFLCSTTDTYVEASNDNFGDLHSAIGNEISLSGNIISGIIRSESDTMSFYENNILLSERVLVDPAGTSVSDALTIQYRQFRLDKKVSGSGGNNEDSWYLPQDYTGSRAIENKSQGVTILSVGPAAGDVDADTKHAYVQLNDDGTVYKDADGNAVILNRENGYKALDDICGAGFSYTSMSEDSVNHSFYMDSVMFYKTEGTYETDLAEDYGQPLTDYYDQRVEIPRSIFHQIDELISEPDLGDYRAVQYISEMLDGYRTAYASVGNDFLTEENLAATAATLGLSSVWEKFTAARDLCVAAGTIVDNGDGTYTYPSNNETGLEDVAETDEVTGLLPQLIRSLEKLPDPSTVTSVSDALEAEVTTLWQIYRRLNLNQLDAMSVAEEQKLVDYIALVSSATTANLDVAGDTLAHNKFVLFNDFETLSVGTESDLFENDPNGTWRYGDYRYTKGFLTYGATTRAFLGTWDNVELNANNPSTDNYGDTMQSGYLRSGTARTETLINGTKAVVTGNGFNGTNGALVTINSSYYKGGAAQGGDGNGMYNIVSVSRNSYSAADSDWSEAMSHNMSDVNLGAVLEGPNGNEASTSFPLGLVFYADFSQLSDFQLTASITTGSHKEGPGANDFTLAMGGSGYNKIIYLMDMSTGEWVDCSASGHGANYFSSDVTASSGLTLAGYKGYIMIPLFQFKDNWTQATTGGTGAVKLSEYAAGLNSIYRVNIGIAPDDSAASSDALEGKTFIIDNIGFGYTNSYNTGSTVHPTFAEVLGVKSQTQVAFEDAVAALEPTSGTNTFPYSFRSEVTALLAEYEALTDYEKTYPSTLQAYELLSQYKADIDANNTAPYAPALTMSSLVTSFQGLSLTGTPAVADGSTSGANDLPYPGLLDTDGDGMADAVNYERYGLTAEKAAQIIEWYNTSYSRFTEEQKTAMGTTRAQFINAYNASMRCVALDGILSQTTTFLRSLYVGDNVLYQSMSALYPAKADQTADGLGTAGDNNVYEYDKATPYGSWTADGATVNEGYFLSVSDANIAALQTAYTQYCDSIDYFGKALLSDGSVRAGAENIAPAIQKLAANTTTHTKADGTAVNGAVQQLIERYTADLDAATAELAANGSLSADTRAQLLTDVKEYDSLINTFNDVAELYDVIQQIYDLTPAATTELSDDAVALSYDNVTGDGTVESTAADPTYQLTAFERYLTDETGTATVTITSSNGGVLSDGAGTTLAYDVSYGGAAVTWGAAADDGSVSAQVEADLAAAMAETKAIHVSVPNAQPTTSTLYDTLTLTVSYTYTDRNGILREMTDEKTVTVTYSTGDFYSVTVPAEVAIPWGAASVENRGVNGTSSTGYKATGNLSGTAGITVTPTASSATLTLAAAGTTETISVGTEQPAPGSFSGSFNEDGAGVVLTVAETEWQSKPLGEYRATDALTYTVDYTPDSSATP